MAFNAVALHLERSAAKAVASAATLAGFERFLDGLRPELIVAGRAFALLPADVRRVSENHITALRLEYQLFLRLFLLSR